MYFCRFDEKMDPMNLKILSPHEYLENLLQRKYKAQEDYLLMYSSWFQGFIDQPSLMTVPVDDHQVHRGDAVFEAIKVAHGKPYLLNSHLDRLQKSAESLSIPWPHSRPELTSILTQMIKIKSATNGVFRVFLSRGPGNFSTNPYDSVGSQFFIVLTKYHPLSEEKYLQGAKAGKSAIEPKSSFWTQIKTCNYLPNVLMKKEAVDRQLDFTFGFDSKGFLTESSTENVILVDEYSNLVRPEGHHILKGTTMTRAFELFHSRLKEFHVSKILERNISEIEIFKAKELMIVGTTWDVLALNEYEGKKIGSGRAGPVALELRRLLKEDQKSS